MTTETKPCDDPGCVCCNGGDPGLANGWVVEVSLFRRVDGKDEQRLMAAATSYDTLRKATDEFDLASMGGKSDFVPSSYEMVTRLRPHLAEETP